MSRISSHFNSNIVRTIGSSPQSSAQLQLDATSSSFSTQASDPFSIASMTLAGLAGKFARMGILSAFSPVAAIHELPLRFISHLGSVGAEAATMALIQNGSFASHFINFATFRLFGTSLQTHNPPLQHLLQSAAMMAGHQVAAISGLEENSHKSLSQQFFDASISTLQIGVGNRLAQKISAGNIQSFERNLEFTENTRAPNQQISISETRLQTLHTIPESLLDQLRQAKNVVVLTGAGVSAESGIPTYRSGENALWNGYNMREIASMEAFTRDPGAVWQWYVERKNQMEHVTPNTAHHALAEMEKRFPNFHIITQNIDGLHQRAGSQNVIELHGNIFRARCLTENKVVAEWKSLGGLTPFCWDCGGMLRPDVVWFEEFLQEDVLDRAYQLRDSCDFVITVGTSNRVIPAASIPGRAIKMGIPVIEINPANTPISKHVNLHIPRNAGEVLPEINRLLFGE